MGNIWVLVLVLIHSRPSLITISSVTRLLVRNEWRNRVQRYAMDESYWFNLDCELSLYFAISGPGMADHLDPRWSLCTQKKNDERKRWTGIQKIIEMTVLKTSFWNQSRFQCHFTPGAGHLTPKKSLGRGAFDQRKGPHGGEFDQKKCQMPGGQPGGGHGHPWNWLIHNTLKCNEWKMQLYSQTVL